MIEAVIFDLDGVLMDSEQLWDQARREVAEQHGGRWREGATEAMQGMSSPEWSQYLHDTVGVELDTEQIVASVVDELLERYSRSLPLMPGAVEVVERLGQSWPLGLASSSNRGVIDAVLEDVGLAPMFAATVSSEEVERGKPAPDVYLEAAARLGVAASHCCAVEDSANGIRSAAAAAMFVAAIPNRRYPPSPDALGLAGLVVTNLGDLTAGAIRAGWAEWSGAVAG